MAAQFQTHMDLRIRGWERFSHLMSQLHSDLRCPGVNFVRSMRPDFPGRRLFLAKDGSARLDETCRPLPTGAPSYLQYYFPQSWQIVDKYYRQILTNIIDNYRGLNNTLFFNPVGKVKDKVVNKWVKRPSEVSFWWIPHLAKNANPMRKIIGIV